jgi:benzylsuccinate CoA-transferase BbsF subunit
MSKDHQNAALPLSGIRVIDASHVFAVPYATAMLADLGAEVIKIQAHTRMDVMAGHGPFPENIPGERAWDRVGSLNTVNRGKLGLSLDLTKPEAIDIFRRLVKVSDVLAESFTPRVMKKLGLDYAALKEIRPDLIMLSNTGYGHSGPWHEYGSVATSLEATTGMCWLSGYEDGPPSKIGQSYTDFLACWNAVYAMLVSLYRRRRTGRGQWIDLSMYQTGASTIGPQIMDYLANGRVATRMGNRHPDMAPHNVYRCKGDDRWIAIAVDSDAAWQILSREMGEPAWARDPRFATAAGRIANEKFIDLQLSAWTAGETAETLAARLQSAAVMAGVVENGRDLLHDEQLRERNFLEPLQHAPESGIGVRRTIGRPWKLSDADLSITRPAPQLGEHNRQVLKDLLGYTDAEIDAMEKSQAIGNVMAGSPVVPPLHLEGMRRNSRIGKPDAAYREA